MVTDLGAGEAEALALALEQADNLVILDDSLARAIASLQNVRITGTAGILLEAKRQGHIPLLAPVLNKLIDVGFWLSNEVRRRILELAGE